MADEVKVTQIGVEVITNTASGGSTRKPILIITT